MPSVTWTAVWSSMAYAGTDNPAAERSMCRIQSLEARSEALNQRYGLGTSARDSASGLTLEAPSPNDALLVGGLLLTIAGATFAVRGIAGGRPAWVAASEVERGEALRFHLGKTVVSGRMRAPLPTGDVDGRTAATFALTCPRRP